MSVTSETGESLPFNQRIDFLQHEHSRLEEALAAEEARPMPDSLKIVSLKRQKLAIKDELTELTES